MLKNVIVLDGVKSCGCACVESVGNGDNSVYIRIKIGDVINPALKIKYTDSKITETLTPNTYNIVKLDNARLRTDAGKTLAVDYLENNVVKSTINIKINSNVAGNWNSRNVAVTKTASHLYTINASNLNAEGELDSELDINSDNAVKNSTITEEFNSIREELNNLDSDEETQDNVEMYVLAENNDATTNEDSDVILNCTLIDQNGEDISANYPEDSYKWIRQSENIVKDVEFNETENFGRTLVVKNDDSVATTTYLCDFLFDEEAGSGHIKNENIKNRVASNTYYNMIYTSDNNYAGGTLSGYGYGVYTSVDLNTFTGSYMNQTEIKDRRVYVRKLGDYEIAFTKHDKLMEYWGTSTGTVKSDLVFIDFIHTDTTTYRLSYDGQKYNIHEMSTPVQELKLVYSTEDKIDWIASIDNVGLLFVSNNNVYEVMTNEHNEVIAEIVFSDFNLIGINKLIAHNKQFVVIGNKGQMAYTSTSSTIGWSTRQLHRQDIVDATSDSDDLICLIDTQGQSYMGTSPFDLCLYKKFDKQPLSINVCGLYMVITYEGYIIYTKLITTFDLVVNSVIEGDCVCAVYYNNIYCLLSSDGYIYSGKKLSQLTKVTTIGNVRYLAVNNDTLYALYALKSGNSCENGVKCTTDLVNWQAVGNNIVSYMTPANYLFFDDNNLYFYIAPYNSKIYVYKYNNTTSEFDISYTSQWANSESAYPIYVNGHLHMCYSRNTVESNYAYEVTSDLVNVDVYQDELQGVINNCYRVYDDDKNAYVLYGNFMNRYSAVILMGEGDRTLTSQSFIFAGESLNIAFIVKVGKWYAVGAHDGYVYASENRVNWFRAFRVEEITTSSDEPRFITAHDVNNKLIISVYYLDATSNTYKYKLYHSK